MKNRMERAVTRDRIMRGDINRAAGDLSLPSSAELANRAKRAAELRTKWTGELENVYRVLVGPTIEVVCLGIDSIDKEAEGTYADMSELPAWMQERVAVLSMMKVDPPQTKIEGIGMRVDESVYWVIKGESNG
jgi:hypothetical protein